MTTYKKRTIPVPGDLVGLGRWDAPCSVRELRSCLLGCQAPPRPGGLWIPLDAEDRTCCVLEVGMDFATSGNSYQFFKLVTTNQGTVGYVFFTEKTSHREVPKYLRIIEPSKS